MKHADHMALTDYLLERFLSEIPTSALFRRLFTLGGILPDYLPHTYLRGVRVSGKMTGHNTPESERHIRKILIRLQKNGLSSPREYYLFGTLIHYLADSFTFPHTAGFFGTMRLHNRYERALHEIFPDCLEKARKEELPPRPALDVREYLRRARGAYEDAPHGIFTDGEWIVTVCTSVFAMVLSESIRNQ